MPHKHLKITPQVCAVFTIVVMSGFSGCGGNSEVQPTDTGRALAAEPEETGRPKTQTPASQTSDGQRRQDERWTDAEGREYLGNVPLDVFFDQPYTVAADTTPIAGDSASTTPMSTGTDSTAATATPAGSDPPAVTETAPGTWDTFISKDAIIEEITSTRNFLNQSLQSVGSYNSSMLMIPPKAASVAVLAQIAIDHPDEVSWREDAIYIRDLAKQMNESTLQRGKKDQVRLQALFENMTDTFNRSRPADLAEPPEEDGLADVAEMGMIMSRMDEAEKRLKTEAGSESTFTSQTEMIDHEAAILRTMTHVITREGYGYEDDEEFVGYADRIIAATRAISDATAAGDFASYEKALSQISTSCTECHQVYRNN